ncbi:MAG: hypothetical protein LBQ31_04585 [Bacteroidales bacterium]|jgi:hypothetical protein|nr:hypothetical protein [Bacteroidales bacterium]
MRNKISILKSKFLRSDIRNVALFLFLFFLVRGYSLPFSSPLLDEKSDYLVSLLQDPTHKFFVSTNTIQQWASIEGHPAIYSLHAEYRPLRAFGTSLHIKQYTAGFERDFSWQASINTSLKANREYDIFASINAGGNYNFYDFDINIPVVTEYPDYANAVANKGYSTFIGAGTGFTFHNRHSSLTFHLKGFYLINSKKLWRVNSFIRYKICPRKTIENSFYFNKMPLHFLFTFSQAYNPLFKNKFEFEYSVETHWYSVGVACGYMSGVKIVTPSLRCNFHLRSKGLSFEYVMNFTAWTKKQLPGKLIHQTGISYLISKSNAKR